MSTPVRTETGGPNRTPRSEITSLRKPGRKYEPAVAIDFSLSMDWSAENEDNRAEEYPHPKSRRAILETLLPIFIAAMAKEDSEAAAEQAGGSDEKGGVYAAGFARKVVKMGDLNESNAKRKLEAAFREMEKDRGREGTLAAPAIKALIDAFDGEFEDDDPEVTRVHEITFLTDGEAQDWDKLLPYLLAANAKRVYAIGIVGHGEAALRTYNAYKNAADQNQAQDEFGKRHVHVVLFDGVTDGREIAEDLITLAS